MADLLVAGAGMAGLVAGARARQLGARVVVREKLGRPGGAMRLSSGVVWRHRDFADFRRECPTGDPALQRLVHERLDGALGWLQELGAPVVERGTANALTEGVRFEVEGLTEALVEAAGGVEVGAAVRELPQTPVVLATGGFAADRAMLRRHVTPEADAVALRAPPGATGDGLRMGVEAGGRLSAGLDEFYGRALPAPPARVGPEDFVAASQVYARHGTVSDLHGERFTPRAWSEIDVVQWMARRPGARARLTVDEAVLGADAAGRTVAERIATAERLGGPVHRRDGRVVVEVVAGVTTTLGGLVVDGEARVAPGVFAAGHDAGGIATGGYASGLAAALVLGLVAAETAAHQAGRP